MKLVLSLAPTNKLPDLATTPAVVDFPDVRMVRATIELHQSQTQFPEVLTLLVNGGITIHANQYPACVAFTELEFEFFAPLVQSPIPDCLSFECDRSRPTHMICRRTGVLSYIPGDRGSEGSVVVCICPSV